MASRYFRLEEGELERLMKVNGCSPTMVLAGGGLMFNSAENQAAIRQVRTWREESELAEYAHPMADSIGADKHGQ